MKVVTYNIQYTRGKDDRYDVERIVDAVKGADIIALQEVERFLVRTRMTDQVEEIAALMPDLYWVYGPAVDLAVVDVGASGKVDNRRSQHGNMLLSRWPIVSSRNHLMPYMGSTTHENAQACALEGVIDIGARALRFYSLHLSHLSEKERLIQTDWLLDLNKRVPLEGGVWSFDPGPGDTVDAANHNQGLTPPPMPFDAVYMGDFNFHGGEPQDPEYSRMVGPMDPDYGRIGFRDTLVDAWTAAGNKETDGITYPANERYSSTDTGWRLDYVFVTPTLASSVKAAWIDNDAQGSDHQPMWAELDL